MKEAHTSQPQTQNLQPQKGQDAPRSPKLDIAAKEFMRETPIKIGSDYNSVERLKPDFQTLEHKKVAEHPREFIDELISNHRLCLFSHSGSPRSAGIKRLLNRMNAEFHTLDLDLRGDTETLERILMEKCPGKNLPILFMAGVPMDSNDVKAAHDDKTLEQRIRNAGGFTREYTTSPQLRARNKIYEDIVEES